MSHIKRALHEPSTADLRHDTNVRIPGVAALELASCIVEALRLKLTTERLEQEEAGQEDAAPESLECLNDLGLTQHSIDPRQWVANKAGDGIPPDQHADTTLKDRLTMLLKLGQAPKAQYVMADAVELRRATRGASETANEEDLLEFLLLLASGKLPPGFLQLAEHREPQAP
ncbi:unnamed protein product [Parajaminaea phylloscopi]